MTTASSTIKTRFLSEIPNPQPSSTPESSGVIVIDKNRTGLFSVVSKRSGTFQIVRAARCISRVAVCVRGHFELVNQRSQLRGHLRQCLRGFHRFMCVGGGALRRLRHA